jgi:hypothetical protein
MDVQQAVFKIDRKQGFRSFRLIISKKVKVQILRQMHND